MIDMKKQFTEENILVDLETYEKISNLSDQIIANLSNNEIPLYIQLMGTYPKVLAPIAF